MNMYLQIEIILFVAVVRVSLILQQLNRKIYVYWILLCEHNRWISFKNWFNDKKSTHLQRWRFFVGRWELSVGITRLRTPIEHAITLPLPNWTETLKHRFIKHSRILHFISSLNIKYLFVLRVDAWHTTYDEEYFNFYTFFTRSLFANLRQYQ